MSGAGAGACSPYRMESTLSWDCFKIEAYRDAYKPVTRACRKRNRRDTKGACGRGGGQRTRRGAGVPKGGAREGGGARHAGAAEYPRKQNGGRCLRDRPPFLSFLLTCQLKANDVAAQAVTEAWPGSAMAPQAYRPGMPLPSLSMTRLSALQITPPEVL